MKKAFLSLILGWLIISTSGAQEITKIDDLFKIKCAICHTIGGGKLIGPDLADVTSRRSEEWLLEFIRSSQKMINSGDPDAVAIYEEYNKVLMPDPMIPDDQILSLLNYIEEQSGSGPSASQTYVSMIEDATAEDIESGRRLFDGRKRFVNGGTSCISCHNDISDFFFSENSLSSKDVRTSFATLGEAGVRAILENPPFPLMAQALKDRPLTEEEVHDLLVYLKEAGAAAVAPTPSSGFFLYGVFGAVLLLFLFAGLWYNRKTRSVNHGIFRRQIRSAN